MNPWGCFPFLFDEEEPCPVTAFAYECSGLGGVFFWGPVFRGQFAELCPAVRHVRQEGGEPGHEARTVCPKTSKATGV